MVNAASYFIFPEAKGAEVAAEVATSAGEKSGTITVYRVEGIINNRLNIGSSGGVSISGSKTLFLNFGNLQRAEELYARRVAQGMKGVHIKSFQVLIGYAKGLSDQAVLESEAHLFPDSPLRVDIKHHGQYGLRTSHIEELKRVIVPGSGRIIR